MQEARRLFDILDIKVETMPKPDMLAAKEQGKWRGYATHEVKKLSVQLAAGLLRIGLSGNDLTAEKQDKIAIIANNRPEWVITDFATQQMGAVLAPIYPTISSAELAYVLKDADVKIMFVSDKELYDKIMEIKNELPSLKTVYTYDKVPGAAHWTELLGEYSEEEYQAIQRIRNAIQPETLATIIYTSGTTGNPKGVMLTHHNILSNVLSCMECFSFADPSGRALSFLPLNHIFERMVTYVYLNKGVSVYYAESMDTIGDNLKEVKPVVFTTVPRLLEKVYEKIVAKGHEQTGIKKALFFWALNLASKFEINTNQGIWYNMQLALANKLVLSKWREALGGNVKAIVTGAAACQVKQLRTFTGGGIVVMEGYGLTETSPVISVNRFEEKNRMFGTVGPLIKGVEVKIAEDGEILFKGDNVTIGYYKRPDLTEEAMKGGWFHTGDIGEIVNGRFLKITDRKKELFKTSGGKYVAPQPIENKMKESRFIEQIMVVGENRKFAGALVVPAWSHVQSAIPGLSGKPEEMAENPEVKKLIRSEIDKYNPQFSHVEQVKRFELIPTEWTIQGGELTPTLKLKRKVILQKYESYIDKIYHKEDEVAAH